MSVKTRLRRRFERLAARAARGLGMLPWLTDTFLYRRARQASDDVPGTSAQGPSDGLDRPLPPPKLRFSSAGTDDVGWFLSSGRRGAEVVLALVEELSTARGGAPVDVLDFGCGCGRVLRHLDPSRREASSVGSVYGVDWNRRAVGWCREALDFATFEVGGLEPPLAFDEALRVELIYAFSVFTHLPEATQRAWLGELARRLQPGGLLALSTHGDAVIDQLDADERRGYEAGELVVRRPSVAGTNVCAAYHPAPALARLLPPSLEVVRHEPEGARGNPPQDLWVLRCLPPR